MIMMSSPEGMRGVMEKQTSKGGCVNSSKCRQGGWGSKNQKVLPMSFMEAPSCELWARCLKSVTATPRCAKPQIDRLQNDFLTNNDDASGGRRMGAFNGSCLYPRKCSYDEHDIQFPLPHE